MTFVPRLIARRHLLRLVVSLLGLSMLSAFAGPASAACLLHYNVGIDSNSDHHLPVVFSKSVDEALASYRTLYSRPNTSGPWGSGLPQGTYVSQPNGTPLFAISCQDMHAFARGEVLDYIFHPGPAATPYQGTVGPGVMIPTNLPGLSLAIMFSGADVTALGGGRIRVATATMGTLPGRPNIPRNLHTVHFAIVVTGNAVLPDGVTSTSLTLDNVKWGEFHYVRQTDGYAPPDPLYRNELVVTFTPNSQVPGFTLSRTTCDLNQASLASDKLFNGGLQSVVVMPTVSTALLESPGAFAGTTNRRWGFTCQGNQGIRPRVKFSARNGHVAESSVALPSEDAVVGIQLLMNDQPVPLGEYIEGLEWNTTTAVLSRTAECFPGSVAGACTHTSQDWIISENRRGVPSTPNGLLPLAFRYYRPTATEGRPAVAGAFQVVIDVLLETP